MTSDLPNNLSIDHLLQTTKALEPLVPEVLTRLEEIEQLDALNFSEADVREEIISPILQALGYRKQTDFSVDREKHLKLVDDDLFVDYTLTLWKAHFWVIEAKKVKRKRMTFIGSEIKQALVYAAHPDIDAPLLVLCDGRMFYVYDREVSLTEPIVKVRIKNLRKDFDKLRVILSPWQHWFFQKRRVLRLIDKVFDREFNLERLAEFRAVVDSRLASKRSIVLENYQALSLNMDGREQLMRELPNADLIDLQFFLGQTARTVVAISQTLTQRCVPSAFQVLHQVFRDHPRDTNSNYWCNALHFLLTLDATGTPVNWLPSYLRIPDTPLSTTMALGRLIPLCLTNFASDTDRQTIILYAASARRIAKQFLVTVPDATSAAARQHALFRFHTPELDFSQFYSSPAVQLGNFLNHMELAQTNAFVATLVDDRNHFQHQRAEQGLRDLWVSERDMLRDGNLYRSARAGRELENSPWSEAIAIGYDQLGHMALCVLDHFPTWKAWTMDCYRPEVEILARYGSWQAKRWLGLKIEDEVPRPAPADIARRFFKGDEELLQALADGYGVRI